MQIKLLVAFCLLINCCESAFEKQREESLGKAKEPQHPHSHVTVGSDQLDPRVKTRDKKLLNLFTLVRFQNGPCRGSNGRNGTCYTSGECSQRGGTASGTCASIYGVCCTFSFSCGQRSNENCTYFEATNAGTSGACTLTICPCNSNICQLRLDFSSFVISGPSTSTTTAVKLLNGVVTPSGATAAGTAATQCLTDIFSVSSGNNGCGPSPICGTNTGEHMYVDADSNCNDLTFQLGVAVAARSWSIKVTQYSCNYDNLAPQCCNQYYFGNNVDTVRTFNYNGGDGSHLANQRQNICIRRERNACRICWTTQNDGDFQLSGQTMTASGFVNSACCGYGAKGTKKTGYDCVMIPGASTLASNGLVKGSKFCGRSKGLVTTTGIVSATICSMQTPFSIEFLSDTFEFGGTAISEATVPDSGFQLTYIQSC